MLTEQHPGYVFNRHCTFVDMGYGITLTHYDRQTVRFLQADSVSRFRGMVQTLNTIWEVSNPNPDIFGSFEDHLDLIIEPYFEKGQ